MAVDKKNVVMVTFLNELIDPAWPKRSKHCGKKNQKEDC